MRITLRDPDELRRLMYDSQSPAMSASKSYGSIALSTTGRAEPGGQLTWAALASIVYFSVGGGPYGFEESLVASTPATCFWALIAMGLLWALPQALCIAELSTRYEFGYNEWVGSTMGETIAMAHSTLRLVFNFLSNAIYANLFVQYLTSAAGLDPNDMLIRTGLIAGFEFVVVFLTLMGPQIVSKVTMVLVVLVITPFLVMFFWGSPHIDFGVYIKFFDANTIDPSVLLSVLMFNLMGWDFVGNLSSQAKKPSRDVPIAIIVALCLVLLTYIIPLITVVALLPYGEYEGDVYASAARTLWKPLAYFVTAAAFLGILGLGSAFMSTSSEAVAHASVFGYLPGWLGKRYSVRRIPLFAILMQSFVALAISSFFTFTSVVQLETWIFSVSTFVISFAFVLNRVHENRRNRNRNHAMSIQAPPAMPQKGFKLPIPVWLATFMALLPMVLSLSGCVIGSWQFIVAGVAVLVGSIIVSFIWTFFQYKRVCDQTGEDLPCFPIVSFALPDESNPPMEDHYSTVEAPRTAFQLPPELSPMRRTSALEFTAPSGEAMVNSPAPRKSLREFKLSSWNAPKLAQGKKEIEEVTESIEAPKEENEIVCKEETPQAAEAKKEEEEEEEEAVVVEVIQEIEPPEAGALDESLVEPLESEASDEEGEDADSEGSDGESEALLHKK